MYTNSPLKHRNGKRKTLEKIQWLFKKCIFFFWKGLKKPKMSKQKQMTPPQKNHFVFTFLSHRKNDECPNFFLSMKLLLKLGASTNKKFKYKRISELI